MHGKFNWLAVSIRLNNEYKYIFTIIGHFSRMADSFLLKNKTGQNIVNYLSKYIELYGRSFEFCSDNRKEFANSSVQNFAINNDIKLIKGRPYNRKNQAVVELIHSTIRKSLLSKYL